MIHKEFDELRLSGQLPSPSRVGMQILVLTQRDDWSLDDLVKAMSSDPALTGRVLRLANSALLSRGSAVATVQEAAMRLGIRSLRNVALGFTLISGNRTGTCEEFDYDAYWADSLLMAVAASCISRETGLAPPAECFTCGLLGRIGELALASVHPATYGELILQARSVPAIELTDLEQEHFSIDSDEVGMAMVTEWGLPDAYVQAIGNWRRNVDARTVGGETTQTLIHTLRIARAISGYCLAAPEDQKNLWPSLLRLREKLGLEEEPFEQLCDEILRKWREWGEFLELELGEYPGGGAEEAANGSASARARTRATRKVHRPDEPMLILAVDDEPVSLRLLARHLETTGHRVITASNGRQAMVAALEQSPQIIVTDWMMPEMDGVQLCQALRQYRSGRNIYIIVLTGRDGEEEVVRAFEAGADDYVSKPFKPRLLLARVRAGERFVRLQQQVDSDRQAQQRYVEKLSALTRELRQAAMTDPLTQLPNRRYAMKRLEEEWANTGRSGRPFSVVMMDLDHFKAVNDTWGHDVGDHVLTRTAATLREVIRGGDTCARMGGEEFLVICPDTDLDGALQVGERLREAMRSNVFQVGDQEFTVTTSVGVAERTREMEHSEILLKTADLAVYEAKESGRDRVVANGQPAPRRKSA